MKNRILPLLLASGILLSPSGCGISHVEVVRATPVPSPTAALTPVPSLTPEVTAAPLYDCTGYVGEKTEEGFTLPRFDLCISVDEGWVASDWRTLWEEDSDYDFTTEEDFLAWLQETGEIKAFRAVREDGFARLLVTVQREPEHDTASSEEEFIAKTKDDMASTVTQSGFSYVDSRVISCDLGGVTHVGMAIHGKMESVDVYITMVAIQSGNLYAVVTASSYVKDETESLLEMVDTLS